MTDQPDGQIAEWVRRARGGSDRAFAHLVDAHSNDVRLFARRFVPSTDEADDLAQDAFFTAWRNIRQLKDENAFRSWLMGIVWRKAKTRARGWARTRARDEAWETERQTAASPRDETARIALNQALMELAPERRACVALNLGAGFSHFEVAQALDLPLGTVKSHITRGRAELAALLGVEDET